MSDSNYTVLRNAHLSLATGIDGYAHQSALGALRFACTPESLTDIPTLNVPVPVLAGDACDEVWLSNSTIKHGLKSGIAYSSNDDWLFGILELEEDIRQTMPVKDAAEAAYQRIFGLLAEHDYPHLYRCWNYIARINDGSNGLERYRQFNLGRQDAFLSWGRSVNAALPAACALGTSAGPLQVAFLAGRAPFITIENPRQLSAYAYPEHYGPRSPTFSRASLITLPDTDILFISGTASIVGHRTEHPGNVIAQTRETLANLEAVIHQANLASPGKKFDPAQIFYRVYVRHAADLPVIRGELIRLTGRQPQAVFLQADICREDLLLEIEATAYTTPSSPSDGQ